MLFDVFDNLSAKTLSELRGSNVWDQTVKSTIREGFLLSDNNITEKIVDSYFNVLLSGRH